jgi:hypothetical protein
MNNQTQLDLAVTAKPKAERAGLGIFARKWGTLAGFAILVIAFSLLQPTIFPTYRNFSTLRFWNCNKKQV